MNYDSTDEDPSFSSILNNPITPYPQSKYFKPFAYCPMEYCLSNIIYHSPDEVQNDGVQLPLNRIWKKLQSEIMELIRQNQLLIKQIEIIRSNISPFFDIQHCKIEFHAKNDKQSSSISAPSSYTAHYGNSYSLPKIDFQQNCKEEIQKDHLDLSFKSRLLEDTIENKASFDRIMKEEAANIGEIALYFHINPHLSSSFKFDFMRTIERFRKCSPSLCFEDAGMLLSDSIQNLKLNESTMIKMIRHLRIYFKDCWVMEDQKVEDFGILARSIMNKNKSNQVTSAMIVSTYK